MKDISEYYFHLNNNNLNPACSNVQCSSCILYFQDKGQIMVFCFCFLHCERKMCFMVHIMKQDDAEGVVHIFHRECQGRFAESINTHTHTDVGVDGDVITAGFL